MFRVYSTHITDTIDFLSLLSKTFHYICISLNWNNKLYMNDLINIHVARYPAKIKRYNLSSWCEMC